VVVPWHARLYERYDVSVDSRLRFSSAQNCTIAETINITIVY
jgi:hypothetical protein